MGKAWEHHSEVEQETSMGETLGSIVSIRHRDKDRLTERQTGTCTHTCRIILWQT